MLTAAKYRLYPTKAQEELLASHFGCVRLVYNLALDAKTWAWSSRKVHLSRFEPLEGKQKLLSRYHTAMHVENVYSGEKRHRFLLPEIDSAAFFGKPDRTYFLDDYVRFTRMEEVMREYVPEVAVRRRGGEFHFMAINLPFYNLTSSSGPDNFFREDPLVLLDGVPVLDIDKIIAYDPLKVEKLEIIASRYFFGPLVADGILSYTTYKGNLDGFQPGNNALIMDYEGLQLQREFYAPAYETPEQLSGHLPDFRDLLFWSPDVKTTGEGKKSISFYTSDLNGDFIGVIQGITPDGQAGSAFFRFHAGE